jgi:hypothetical protein
VQRQEPSGGRTENERLQDRLWQAPEVGPVQARKSVTISSVVRGFGFRRRLRGSTKVPKPTLVIWPGRVGRDMLEHVGDDALRQIVRFDLVRNGELLQLRYQAPVAPITRFKRPA